MKYGPFRMLQVMHILHREENEKRYLCRESRREKGIRKHKKKSVNSMHTFYAKLYSWYIGHDVNAGLTCLALRPCIDSVRPKISKV